VQIKILIQRAFAHRE